MLGGTSMISAEELRNIPTKSQKLNFYERHQLRKIERKVKRSQKKGKLFINIRIILWRDGKYILEALKQQKGYNIWYYYTRYTGHHLVVSWEKKQ